MSRRVAAHVITGLNVGGAEMMLFKLLSHGEDAALKTRVISLTAAGPVRERIEAIGVTVDSLNMRRGVPSFTALRRLRAIGHAVRPEILQGWMYHGNVAASAANWLWGGRTPVVWNVRQSLYDLKKERLLTRWVIRANAWLSRRANAIIYNSHTSARQHEAFGFDASLTHIIPNGFDTDLFCPDAIARASIRRELGLGDHVVLIGLIGRYHPMKDHRMFLRAAALLARGCPDVHFLLAGSDVDAANPAVASMIVESGMSDRVSLLGERNDTPRLNAALDIACSASAWGEAFSNVVGEAMSCGVPCVVTDVGDSARIVGDTGIVVPPRDPDALVVAWKRLMSLGREGRQALGARARQRVIEEFSLGAVVRQYEELYESVIAEARV